MKKNRLKQLVLIVVLIAITSAAMAYTSGKANRLFANWASATPRLVPDNSDVVRISGNLIQNKILHMLLVLMLSGSVFYSFGSAA